MNQPDKPVTAEEVLDQHCDSLPAWTENRKQAVLRAMQQYALFCVNAQTDYLAASQSRPPCLPMQWRKASEGLPESGIYNGEYRGEPVLIHMGPNEVYHLTFITGSREERVNVMRNLHLLKWLKTSV